MADSLIDFVTPPGTQAAIGMIACPGRRPPSNGRTDPERDLTEDLEAVRAWKPQLVIALLSVSEFVNPPFAEFKKRVTAAGLPWQFSAVGNYGVPEEPFMDRWENIGAQAREILRGDGRVLIHCRYGLGRTGLVTAMLLVELGTEPEEAIRLVRAARPNAIQNDEQKQFVLDYRP